MGFEFVKGSFYFPSFMVQRSQFFCRGLIRFDNLTVQLAKLPIAHRGENQGAKKTAETDTIFENVWQVNALAD